MWAGEKIKEKYQNCCNLKTMSELLIFDVHIWGTYMHIYTKYEVSMSNPVPGEVCTDDSNHNDATANDDG